jgi:acetyl-CoA/propionyl-CoA carboxylase biotin carboxyl carrier protein
VRLDAGYEAGDTVSQYYDNLIAKLIVWAPDREAARRRMLRAIGETSVTGVATTLPAHEAILSHPDFAAATHSTRWVEETLDLSGLVVEPPGAAAPAPDDDSVPTVQRDVTAEVDGRRFSVRLWVPDLGPAAAPGRAGGRPKRAAASAVTGSGSGQVTVPMQGTIVKVLVAVGDVVEVGQAVCLLEAMKMENAVAAEKDGVIKEVRVSAGDSVGAGDIVAVIE